ncbi:protein arginine N-methyltransferase 9-like [Uloborus diversus]|uniref:protein arginine N-methyltransferase 9-like n=1 Tax=Uloborus diversus TaxID=327109 RepID=UPI00240A0134|nr:protein arginine N-methyltransferase 9-like [Uloborus diversus]
MDADSEHWSSGRQLLLQRCKSRALSCLNEHEYSRAFAHFIVALTVEPAVKGELLNAFIFTLEKIASDLEKEQQVNEVLLCYQQALDVLPNDSHVLHGLATTLFRLGFIECAASYFLKSYQANPFFTPSLYCMENLKNALVERWHFVMLNDSHRNMAYHRAIKRAVKSGYNQVLDIGAGTGILSMMAVDAGAEKVYACEASEIMSAVLQNVIETNNKDITAFSKFSTDLCVPDDLPEKVSLIVTEIFDAGLFGEHVLETLNHAWEHLLVSNANCVTNINEKDEAASSISSLCSNVENAAMTPNREINVGKIIPYSATVYAVPVESRRLRKNFALDMEIMEALNIKNMVAPQLLDEEPYSTEKLYNIPDGYKLLSKPSVLLEVNFNSPQDIKSLLQGKVLNIKHECTDNGMLDAMIVWFDLHLDDETTISTAPNSEVDSCWEQAIFFALPQCLKGSSPLCSIGDCIESEFLCQGHLTLKSIKTRANNIENNFNQTLTMDPSLINLLNTYSSGNIINLNLRDIYNVDNAAILDISTFPTLTLKALKDSPFTATVLKTQYQSEVEQLRDLYQISKERLVFKSYEELYKSKMQCDFLIVDPVEPCGLLKKNLLEDITMLRMQSLKETGIVVPGEIEIMAILIESPVLKEHSKVISDERTAGYKISQVMNAYQCRIHQDIQYSMLPYTKITEPVKLCSINLNSKCERERKSLFKDMHRTTEVEAINNGQVTAIIYFFVLKYHQNFVVDTSDHDGLRKQAACILDEGTHVQKGEKVHLQWCLKNGCIQIGISNGTSTT